MFVVGLIVAATATSVRAGLIDDFEDGDITQNPAWTVVYPAGAASVVMDPLRPGNHVLQAYGSDGAHRILSTPVNQGWQGFAFQVEFMATNSGNYGPAFVASSDTYNLGTRFPIATTDPFANGHWYIADNAVNSPEWWAHDTNPPAFVIPAWQWLRIGIAHDPMDGLIHGSIFRVSDGALLAQRTYNPSIPVPTSQITSFVLGIEETSLQYVDNIYLTPEPASAFLVLTILAAMRSRRSRRFSQ
jgi:hypothetical protein